MICSRPDVVLPSHLHALFLGLDANFRLKRKNISSDNADPGLGDGWAYFVEEKEYKEHLSKFYDEKEPVSEHTPFLCKIYYRTLFRKAHVRVMTPSIYLSRSQVKGTPRLVWERLSVCDMICIARLRPGTSKRVKGRINQQ